MQASGLGREGGQHSLDFYTDSRIVHVALEATPVLDLGGNPRPAIEQHQILESAVGANGFRIR